MNKQEIIAALQKKIQEADFDDHGIVMINLNAADELSVAKEMLNTLKVGNNFEITLDETDKSLKVYSVENDLEAFSKRHPNSKQCAS